MKRLVLAAVALSAVLAVPAAAQYGPGVNSYDYRGPTVQEVPVVPRGGVRVQRYDYDDSPRYERRRRVERDYYDDRPRGYGGYNDGYGRRASRGGGVCVTSRGSCPTFRPLPRNAPCRCDIPGFGEKRGAVAY